MVDVVREVEGLGGRRGLGLLAVELVARPLQGLRGPLGRQQRLSGGVGVLEELAVLVGSRLGGDADGALRGRSGPVLDRPRDLECRDGALEDDPLEVTLGERLDRPGRDALTVVAHVPLGLLGLWLALLGELGVRGLLPLVLGLGQGTDAASDAEGVLTTSHFDLLSAHEGAIVVVVHELTCMKPCGLT